MATSIIGPGPDAAQDRKSGGRRNSSANKKRTKAMSDSQSAMRFFPGKANGGAPVLERELPSENEALLESLKSGQNYFVVSEWRAVADLSKEVPQIRRETVKREERDQSGAPAVSHGPRSGAAAQAS